MPGFSWLRPRPCPERAGGDSLRLLLFGSRSVSAYAIVATLGPASSGCGLWSQAARV